MIYKATNENEWNDIIKKVAEAAEQIGKQLANEYADELYSKNECSTEKKHTAEKELIKQALERYRDEPLESNIRKGVEWLLNEHARLQDTVPEYEREQYRKRHNALVLKYIVEIRMSDNHIGKKLQASWGTVQNMVDKGISELSSICFGYIE
jgi:hypothetical protein